MVVKRKHIASLWGLGWGILLVANARVNANGVTVGEKGVEASGDYLRFVLKIRIYFLLEEK